MSDKPNKALANANKQLGSNAKCKACRSGRRLDIDRRLLDGDTTRKVSAWLADQGEKIRFDSLATHRKRHIAVMERAKEKLAEAQVAAAADKIVANADLLDEMASMGVRVLRGLMRADPRTPDVPPMIGASMPEVVLFNGTLREVREAVKTKHEMLNGKKVNHDGLDGLAGLLGLALDEEVEGDGEDAPGALAE